MSNPSANDSILYSTCSDEFKDAFFLMIVVVLSVFLIGFIGATVSSGIW
jgi:hypothetical protein